jgi:hypothetical protein
VSVSPNQPVGSSKNVTGDFDAFSDFARRIVSVPHSEIKAKLEAEREAKRTSKASVSRVAGVLPKRAR